MNGSRNNDVRPRVILDIALIGEAHREKTYARGVHRVAEQIVRGLEESGECDLRFVATSNLLPASKALRQWGFFTKSRLFYRPYQMILSRLAESGFGWVQRTLSNRKLHLRALRRLVQYSSAWANASSKHIPVSAFRGFDIYHSPLAPIPKSARNWRNLRKFLTVVDVIPLSNPSTVGGKGVSRLREQLDSLSTDSFAFCISETVKNELLQIKDIPSKNVFITPLAASEKAFHPVSNKEEIQETLRVHGIPDKPYFLTLSSFDPRKNFDFAIECFGKLIERGALEECSLVIVGSNPERNEFVECALASFPAAKRRVFTPGFIPDSNLAAIYSGALAFLFPSLSEGFGIPALEAMQCGTPIISSNAPALPEVIGEGGILLDPRDRRAWSDAMIKISSDSSLRETLRARALDRSKMFTWRRFITETMIGYHKSLRR